MPNLVLHKIPNKRYNKFFLSYLNNFEAGNGISQVFFRQIKCPLLSARTFIVSGKGAPGIVASFEVKHNKRIVGHKANIFASIIVNTRHD